MTEQDELDFTNAKCCHICKVKYKNDKEEKVRDHDHYTGKYKGSAHKTCNSKFYYEKSLNVFFHNLKGYDSHFLIQEIGKFKKKIGIIPNNIEKFLSFSIGNIKFKDSYQFLNASLDSLTKNLVEKEIAENNPDVFKHLSSEFSGDKLQLMKRK